MQSPSKRQAVYKSWKLSSTSELKYYLTAFPVTGTVHIFLWPLCEINAACGYFLFPVQTQEREKGDGVTCKYRLLDLYSTPPPLSSNHLYFSVCLSQPHFPMLLCHFVCCFSLWSAASSVNLMCEMLRGWLLGVNPRVKCSHVLKYYGSKV